MDDVYILLVGVVCLLRGCEVACGRGERGGGEEGGVMSLCICSHDI